MGRQRTQRPNPTAVAARVADRLERTAAIVAAALVLVRPLFPSEDADAGSGLLVVALWGVVGILWAASQWARGPVRIVVCVADAGAVVLLAAVLISAAWAEARRPALIMACEWTSLVLSYFLVRQLFRRSEARHALALILAAAAVSLASYGIYQVFWGLQPLRAEYLSDPSGVLETIGIAPGSPQEQSFKNRLMSHEPFATFALANSLAGFLVAWLPIGLVWLFGRSTGLPNAESATHSGRSSASDETTARREGGAAWWVAEIVSGVGMLAMVLCLVLTQSRTAYAACLVQIVLLALAGGAALVRTMRQRPARRAIAIAAVMAVVALAVALIEAKRLAKIDAKLVTQATKSLGYRWQYWTATVDLVSDHLWAGVGPGNFRSHYLKYKLPESSEEIADPHNMVLELCATSGAFAGAAFVFTLFAALWRAGRSSASTTSRQTELDWRLLAAAGAGGWVAAMVLAPLEPIFHCLLALGWCLAAASLAVVGRHSSLGPRTFAVAALGLAIHLLGAGGIGMPGVAQSLWVLLALGLNARDEASEPWVRGPWCARALLAAATAMVVWFGLWVLQPVTAAQSAVAVGRWRLSQGELAAAEAQFQAAARSDPEWVEPWLELSRIHYQRWWSGRRRTAESEFDLAAESLRMAAQVSPRDLESRRLEAELFAARGRRDQSPAWWSRAADSFRACVELYPTSATLHARLADSLWQAGNTEAAQQEMQRALELDAGTPHVDKKLSNDERAVIMQRLDRDKRGTLEQG